MIYSFEQLFPSSISLTVVIGIRRTTGRDHEFLPDANVVDNHFLGFSRSVFLRNFVYDNSDTFC